MKRKIKRIGFALGIVSAITLLANGASAWVDPIDGQNIFAPLNTSSIGQTKLGGLVLNTGEATYGLIVKAGLVGIGVDKPSAKLEVGGDIKADNLILNQSEGRGAMSSREVNNGEKIKTNELCFTKQGTTEDCRDSWPEVGGGPINPEGPNVDGVYNSMYYINLKGTPAFGLGSLFGYPLNSYKDARMIYGAGRNADPSPIFYGEIKYIEGEKYTRVMAGLSPVYSTCDSGYVKGTEATCIDISSGYGIKALWGDYENSRGYIKVTNFMVGYPSVAISLSEPWGARSVGNYGNYVYPLLPDQMMFGRNIYNRSNIDVVNWKYKKLKDVDFAYLPKSMFTVGLDYDYSNYYGVLAPEQQEVLPPFINY